MELLSTKGIDYSELEKLLKAKEWRKADELMAKHMLKVANRESQGYLDVDSIKIFPCKDLWTIDQLWVYYSNGLYGFSVQRDIYVECGGKLDFSYPSHMTWDKFCDRTAWKKDGYVSYPTKRQNFNHVFSRIETCRL
ncbi:GUN4 domain-containing protein [Pseudanabaena sp. lw0831]|uniref:GUN4 domain-containing protein n=1 Tax=Pseudanabaena sp. lw0831 TaxID=1357935 RepID=UPI001915B24D|nr:GUN4 domain-containing protein [Pseudanabaena sp. lw0831]